MHRDDVGVRERGGRPCLAPQPLLERGIGRAVRLEELDGHPAVQHDVFREVDAAHAAGA